MARGVFPLWMYLVLVDIKDALAKIEASCSCLLLTSLETMEALIMTEAFCNFPSEGISALVMTEHFLLQSPVSLVFLDLGFQMVVGSW